MPVFLPFSIPRKFEEPSNKFSKQLERLPRREQEQFLKVCQEFATGQPKPGRKVEKLKGMENTFSARLSRNYRVIYKFDPEKDCDTGAFIAVGHHDSAYK